MEKKEKNDISPIIQTTLVIKFYSLSQQISYQQLTAMCEKSQWDLEYPNNDSNFAQICQDSKTYWSQILTQTFLNKLPQTQMI